MIIGYTLGEGTTDLLTVNVVYHGPIVTEFYIYLNKKFNCVKEYLYGIIREDVHFLIGGTPKKTRKF